MGPTILAVGLVPPPLFARLLDELRARYPGARLSALIGSPELRDELSAIPPDEYLVWQSFTTRALVAELRRRRLDLMVVAHGRGYYTTPTYWKAVGLAIASGARRKLFCPDAELGERVVPTGSLSTLIASIAAVASAMVRGVARTLAGPLSVLYAAASGVVLIPLLAAIAISDLALLLSGGLRAGRGRARGR